MIEEVIRVSKENGFQKPYLVDCPIPLPTTPYRHLIFPRDDIESPIP